MSDKTINRLNIGTLGDGEKWEKVISFMPPIQGAKQKVKFYLYKNDEIQPCFEDPLHLYIDVR